LTGWIILVAVIALLMWLPVRVCVKYKDQPDVVLRIGFIPIRILPAKEKTPEQIEKEKLAKLRKDAEKALKKKEEKEAKKKAKQAAKEAAKAKKKQLKQLKKEGKPIPPEEPKKPSLFSKLKDMYGLSGLLQMFKELVKIVMGLVGGVICGLRIEKLHLNVCVAADDAAQTAYQYGQFCAGIYPTLETLGQMLRIHDRKVNITYDFLGQKSVIDCSVIIRLRVGTVFHQLFRMIGRLIKLLLTQGKYRKPVPAGAKPAGKKERKNPKCLSSTPKA
jgi:hypothetical protein